jgi:hypothetical protein
MGLGSLLLPMLLQTGLLQNGQDPVPTDQGLQEGLGAGSSAEDSQLCKIRTRNTNEDLLPQSLSHGVRATRQDLLLQGLPHGPRDANLHLQGL